MQVLGMTQDILRAISPLITVHSPSGEVNRQAASPAVRRALPKSEFAGVNQPSPDSEGPALSVATVVRVTADATTRNGGHFVREAVLQRSTVPTQPFTVLSWRRRWPG